MISMIMLMINNHDQENNHYDIIIQDTPTTQYALKVLIPSNHDDRDHVDDHNDHQMMIIYIAVPFVDDNPPARGGTVSENLLRIPLSLSNQHDYDDEKPQITKR